MDASPLFGYFLGGTIWWLSTWLTEHCCFRINECKIKRNIKNTLVSKILQYPQSINHNIYIEFLYYVNIMKANPTELIIFHKWIKYVWVLKLLRILRSSRNWWAWLLNGFLNLFELSRIHMRIHNNMSLMRQLFGYLLVVPIDVWAHDCQNIDVWKFVNATTCETLGTC